MRRRAVIRKVNARNARLNCLLPEEQEIARNVVFHEGSAFREPATMSAGEIKHEANTLAIIQEKLKLEGGSPEYARILDRIRQLKHAFDLLKKH